MKVDVVSLGNNIGVLNSHIISLEDNELNLYYKILSLKDIWNDGYTTAFFEAIEKEKRNTLALIRDLRKLSMIYRSVYNSLSRYGNKINVNFDYSNTIKSKYNSINQSFAAINSIYNGLDLRYCTLVASKIRTEQYKFNNLNRALSNYMLRFDNVLNILKTMEMNIKNQCSNLDVSVIESIFFQGLDIISDVSGNVGIKSDEIMEKALGNINISLDSENELFNDINSVLSDLNGNYYSVSNSSLLKNIQKDVICDFKILIKNHNDMVLFINNIKKKYLDLLKKTVKAVDSNIKDVL